MDTCEDCGRRHGARTRVATLKPLEWGRGVGEWAWRDGETWRSCYGRNVTYTAAEVRGPQVWDTAHLTRFTPPDGWESDYGSGADILACDLCRSHYQELADEYEFTVERLPEGRETVGQLALAVQP